MLLGSKVFILNNLLKKETFKINAFGVKSINLQSFSEKLIKINAFWGKSINLKLF